MPNVSGALPLALRASTTRFRARADTIGSSMLPSAAAAISACSAGVTVMALPFTPSPNGATIGTLTWPSPRLEAMAIGAIRWAASNSPMLSLSRTFDHDTSRTSSTSRPSRGGKPLVGGDDQGRGVGERDEADPELGVRAAHLKSSAAVITDCATSAILRFSFMAVVRSKRVRLLLRQALELHEDALGAVDHLARLELALGAVELALQPREGVEARDAQIEDVLHALLLEAVDDVGGDAGVHRRLDGVAVRLVDEHGGRPAHDARDLEHLLQHVAAGVLQVDQDHVGIDAVDLVEQAGGVLHQHDVGKARLTQAGLQDRPPDGVLVDHQDLERGIWRQAGHGVRRSLVCCAHSLCRTAA